MKPLLMTLSALVFAGILALLARNLVSRRYDVFSFRNLFLFGFLIFYAIASFFEALWTFNAELYVPGPDGYRKLILAIPLFLLVFALGCRLGVRMRWPERVVPRLQLPVTSFGVLVSIAALLAAGVLASILGMTSYLNVLMVQFKGGLVCAALALATFYLLVRKSNPLSWVVFLGTFACAAVVSTVGEIGRRQLLGAVLAVGWMWYYYRLRERASGWMLAKLSALAVVVVVVIGTYTYVRFEASGGDTRTGYDFGTRFQQLRSLVTNPRLERRMVFSMFLQDTPVNTMYVMETYPETYEYVPFNGLVFFLGNPIPRAIWPEKPEAMGMVVQRQLQVGANLGIGIIGHGWVEGGWTGIVGYALFFGVLLAALDRLVRQRWENPYFMAAVGCSLGNILALARGETSLFLLLATAGFVGSAVVLALVRLVLGPVMAAAAPLVFARPETGTGDQPEDADASGYATPVSDGDPSYGELPAA
jgi:hypothetical protein